MLQMSHSSGTAHELSPLGRHSSELQLAENSVSKYWRSAELTVCMRLVPKQSLRQRSDGEMAPCAHRMILHSAEP